VRRPAAPQLGETEALTRRFVKLKRLRGHLALENVVRKRGFARFSLAERHTMMVPVGQGQFELSVRRICALGDAERSRYDPPAWVYSRAAWRLHAQLGLN
jgi:hypothetical protein